MKAPRKDLPNLYGAVPTSLRFTKGPDAEVRVELSELNGHRFLNVRDWWLREGAPALPTKRGVTLPLADLPTLLQGLSELAGDAVRRGWIDQADLDLEGR